MSGLPILVESVNELDQKPSNSLNLSFDFRFTFSAIKADIGLWVSIILKKFFASKSLLNLLNLISAVVYFLFSSIESAVEDTPFV